MKIGRWLGVSNRVGAALYYWHRVGAALCYWILTKTGKVIARTTVQHMTQEDVALEDIQIRLQEYHVAIETIFSKDERLLCRK